MSYSPDTSRRRLRIAMVAPPWFNVPPDGYGGIEAMVGPLVDGLVERGPSRHPGGRRRGPHQGPMLIASFRDPPSDRLGDPAPEVLDAARAAAALSKLQLDVVHDHCLAGPLLARYRPTPTVVTAHGPRPTAHGPRPTAHGPVTRAMGDYLASLDRTVGVVAISEAQRRLRPDINWIATVYNSINLAAYQVGAGDGGYVSFLRRFNADKAPTLPSTPPGRPGGASCWPAN